MKKIITFLIIIISASLFSYENVQISSRYNYYTDESQAELLLIFSEFEKDETVTCKILFRENKICSETFQLRDYNFVSFSFENFEIGNNKLTVNISKDDNTKNYNVNILKLDSKENAVKIDNSTGGLIVDDIPYFPFGFYSYWPVQPTLAEEEVVKGFNMISPYQKIKEETFSERKAYMDRCAKLGMKVNYNLCSVVGGGGVGSGKIDLPEKELDEIIREEVEAFKDHPALLAWYIADEPILNGIDAKFLEKKYNLIKSIDPYHPISIVFMKPKNSPQYANAVDIIMSDPYPIPSWKITDVGVRAKYIKQKFPTGKATWIVPQAFGGGEWWEREPTRQELRCMTYQAIINGATGIKYFIRNGLNSFPKSTSAWAECGTIALEVAEITPQLLSNEIAPKIIFDKEKIEARAFLKNGLLTILAVNNINEPQMVNFAISDSNITGKLSLPFENREIDILDGEFSEFIDGYNSRCFQFELEPIKSKLENNNLTLNGDFEINPSPGVVAGFYASARSEHGSTYFCDSKVAYSGRHSMRIINPTENEGIRLKSFPVKLRGNSSYTLSIMAKAKNVSYTIHRKIGFWKKLFGGKSEITKPLKFKLKIGDKTDYFELSDNWKEYSLDIPNLPKKSKKNISFELIGEGTAWFDLMQVIPEIQITSKFQDGKIYAHIGNTSSEIEIRYTTNGTKPTKNSTLYTEPFAINKSTTIIAARIIGGCAKSISTLDILSHKAIGKNVQYSTKYQRYNAGGDSGLVDGLLGSKNFQDNNWQGFIANDMSVIIDLEKETDINEITINFLEDMNSWIFLPENILFEISTDGKNFQEIKTISNNTPTKYRSKELYSYSVKPQNRKARFIKIHAKNPATCPEWHKGDGKATWIFADEIIVR